MDRRRFLAALTVLTGCGGGGAMQYVGGPPAKYRPGILYGYPGDSPESAAETFDHCNLYWLTDWWGGAPGAISNLARAWAAGYRDLVISVSIKPTTVEQTVDAINAYCSQLPLEGWNVRGLYWCDEPNSLPEPLIRGVNRALRGITSAPLWTIFADAAGRPGLAPGDDPAGAWDVVGLDQYDIGCNVLGGLYDDLKRQMKPGARRILVPGPVGGHLSQADPSCFENFAYANPDVLGIIPFIWVDGWGNVPANKGIRSFPDLRATYTALGKRITGKL